MTGVSPANDRLHQSGDRAAGQPSPQGRLAVDKAAQGRGIGGMLPADALKRTLAVSDEIAIYAMAVDAIDQSAQRFYERFGFAPLGPASRRLFLPLKSFGG